MATQGFAPAAAAERVLIADIRARLAPAPPWLLVGPGDDAAVVEPPRGDVEILTTDCVVEGVHFDRRFASPRDIGFKALAVNVSDVAAMGAAPRVALVSLLLPEGVTHDDALAIVEGVLELAASTRVTVAGGNISRTPGPLVVSVTVIGAAR